MKRARLIASTNSRTERRSSSFSSPSNAPSRTATCAALGDRQGIRQVGVTVWGLTVNEDDTPAQVAKAGQEFQDAVSRLQGRAHAHAADALKADFTPEVFVLDSDFVLRYRGRIDNMYSERLKKHAEITESQPEPDARRTGPGRPVSVPATLAIGCPILRASRARSPRTAR